MIIRLLDQPESHQILSAAFDAKTARDLESSQVDYFCIEDSQIHIYPSGQSLKLSSENLQTLKTANNYDVFELLENGVLVRRIDVQAEDNVLFITGHCNSNCLMCPSPEYSRRMDEKPNIPKQLKLASHMPISLPHITITGGEPFLAGKPIFDLLDFLKHKFNQTEFLILTNGRIFCMKEYAGRFNETAPAGILVGIPVHGSTAEIHDRITQSEGSFVQTAAGIENLLRQNVRVEIRIVVSALNYQDLMNIGKLIADRFPNVAHVSIIAMEMTGAARVNKEQVWISYQSVKEEVRKLTDYLIAHQIDVQLYNFPLCTIDPSQWMLARKSISPHKVRYSEKCSDCRVKKQCGGLFAGTIAMEENELEAY